MLDCAIYRVSSLLIRSLSLDLVFRISPIVHDRINPRVRDVSDLAHVTTLRKDLQRFGRASTESRTRCDPIYAILSPCSVNELLTRY